MTQNKSALYLLVLILILFSNQSSSKVTIKPLSLAWIDLSQEQYIDNLVKCKSKLNELKWSYNLWPKENKSPKPLFSEVVDIDKIRQSVHKNLKMETVLAKRFNFSITPAMMQHDLDRMARQTKDAKRLKELFSVLNNDPKTIAQCVSRPYLVQKKLDNQFNYNKLIHAEVKQKAQAELDTYLLSGNADDTTARINIVTYKLLSDDEKSLDTELSSREINKKKVVELDAEEFENRVKKNQNKNLQEHKTSFIYTEIIEEAQNSIKVKVLQWKKNSQNDWLSGLSDINYLPISKKYKYSLPIIFSKEKKALNTKAAVIDKWERGGFVVGRHEHTMIWTGNEMIIWGGLGSNGVLNTGGRYNPVTDSWSPINSYNAPTARSFHTAVWTGSNMIVWGGNGGQGIGDLNTGGIYDLDLDIWKSTSIGTETPIARTVHTTIWTGDEMIIWGGFGAGDYLNSGGRYNPNTDTWVQTSRNNVPSGRGYHSVVWTGNEMIVWGGLEGNGTSANSGGRYDPDTDNWMPTSLDSNVPTNRAWHTAVWTGNEMIIWGGTSNQNQTYYNNGAIYNPINDNWSTLSVNNAPEARHLHTAVWTGDEMIVWGGYTSNETFSTGGRYKPDTDSWTMTNISNAPTDRARPSSVWTGSEMIIWGGGAGSFSNGGRYNPATDNWLTTSLENENITPRFSHTAIWTGNEMIIWGGTDSIDSLNSGGLFNPVTGIWFPTNIDNAPEARQEHTAVWTGSEMIIWGGLGFTGALNTGGRYSPVANSWSPINLHNAPNARQEYTAIWTGIEMIIWGGYEGDGQYPSQYLNTGSRYNPALDNWEPTSTAVNVPAARHNHTAIWTGNEMIVWGGLAGDTAYNTGGRYNPLNDSWSSTTVATNVPSARDNHTAVWTGNEMIIWGGDRPYWNNTRLKNGGRYNPSYDSWEPVNDMTNVPQNQYNHNAVWSGREMIILGEYDYQSFLITGGRYNPATNSWSILETDNAPVNGGSPTAVWTGEEMIVWGGNNVDNTVYLYHVNNYYDIGGTLTGLIGDQVTIQNNGDDYLFLTSDGGFTFNKPLEETSNYEVILIDNPQNPPQTCEIRNSSGIAMADVTDLLITCGEPDLIFNNGFEVP